MFALNPKKFSAETVYVLIAVLTTLGFGLVFTVSGLYYVQTVKLTPLELVLVGTVLELSVFLFEVPTGVVADVLSRRLSVVIGYALIGAGFVVQALIATFAAVLVAQILWGVGYTFTSGALTAWLSDEIGEDRSARVFLRATRVSSITSFVVIPLSIALAFTVYQTPMVLGGLVFVALAVMLVLFMPEMGFAPAPAASRSTFVQARDTFLAGVRVVRSRPAVMTILLISVVFGAASESFDRLWQAHLLSFSFPTLPVLVGLTETQVQLVWFGLIDLLVSVVALVLVRVAERRVQTSSYTATARALLVLTLVLIACLLVFALAPVFAWVLVAYLGARAVRTLMDPLSAAWLNARLESGTRATVLSMNGQADAVGQVVGGPLVGWLGNTSLRLALAVGAVMLAPALRLYAAAFGRGQSKTMLEPSETQA